MTTVQVIIGVTMVVLGLAILSAVSFMIEKNTKAYEEALRNQQDKDR